jgi:hypothetical protein
MNPATTAADFEVVILTTAATGTPHLAALQEANPDLVIHVHKAKDATHEAARLDAWRNCDRNLREWWQDHGFAVKAERVLFLEWDVFCNVPLQPLIPAKAGRAGLVAASIKTAVRDARSWPVFQETKRLPAHLRAWACGAVPFAALLIDRLALDALSAPQWDELFEADLFCELRTPTILRFLGMSVTACPAWNEVTTQPRAIPAGFRGLFHPAKQEVTP